MAEDLTVIGCGLPRTGTLSMQSALQQLLDGKCYHAYSINSKKHIDFWMDSIKTPEALRKFLLSDGNLAGVDYPVCFYYKELMEAFPKAKLVLTVREPKSWYLSVKKTLLQNLDDADTFPLSLLVWLMGMTRALTLARRIAGGMFTAVASGEDEAVKYFNAWVDDVKANVPPEQLLVFDVRHGWEPLCKFLDIPVPDMAFPRGHSTEEFVQRSKRMKTVVWTVLIFLVSCFVILIAFLGRYIFNA